MSTRIADDVGAIAARMRELGLVRDAPKEQEQAAQAWGAPKSKRRALPDPSTDAFADAATIATYDRLYWGREGWDAYMDPGIQPRLEDDFSHRPNYRWYWWGWTQASHGCARP